MVYGEQNNEGNHHLICILCAKIEGNFEKLVFYPLFKHITTCIDNNTKDVGSKL